MSLVFNRKGEKGDMRKDFKELNYLDIYANR
jgi:hypothetical protein